MPLSHQYNTSVVTGRICNQGKCDTMPYNRKKAGTSLFVMQNRNSEQFHDKTFNSIYDEIIKTVAVDKPSFLRLETLTAHQLFNSDRILNFISLLFKGKSLSVIINLQIK